MYTQTHTDTHTYTHTHENKVNSDSIFKCKEQGYTLVKENTIIVSFLR